ncbi:hypothetical protein K432DRAFT_381582 [Lepidopterella palustris CBS 459.81]|uniref:Peptidase A1 domain-containing protein n=1 Tax=Lepidopterella palustris CBS 459.81 TaxID=1314670 RepID=A0A8E2EBV4_9PEZI|nr:hypothetical protein K432DRAFT_381582 [Lepidopterella palustris CBS 459.81]
MLFSAFVLPVVLLVSLVAVSASPNCSIPPLLLPVMNNTFSDGVGLNRGISLSIGTPGQLAGMRMTMNLNNTRLRNAADCNVLAPNNSAVVACRGSSSSTFDPDLSTSWMPVLEGDWNVSSIDFRPTGNGTTVIQGYDKAVLSANNTAGLLIPGFPFEVWSDASSPNKSALGLGADSSFLQSLAVLGYIPSKVLGLFYGSRSESRPYDGELVIGGYNNARISTGVSLTDFEIGGSGALSIACPLQVLIKDIVLGNSKGSFSVIETGSTIPACIDPLQAQFTFTSAMYARWESLTNHTFDAPGDGSGNYTMQTYPLSAEPLIGNLTITLSNGYTTVIPHYELLSHERGSDPEGKYAITNSSRLMAAVGTGLTDYGIDVPLLGGVYLSQNYLVVDYFKQKFSLAPAVIGAINGKSADIYKVCESSTSPATSSATPSPSSSPSKSKTNAGAITGGVVGGVVFLGLCVGLFFWLRKRDLHSPDVVITHEDPPTRDTSKISPRTPWQPGRLSSETI